MVHLFRGLDFIAAFGVIGASIGINGSDTSTGVILFAVGISGGFVFLALAKILSCFEEAVFRLRDLEEYATRKP